MSTALERKDNTNKLVRVMLILFACISCLFVVFCACLSANTHVYTVESPTGQGRAIIYSEEFFLARDCHFYIYDPNSPARGLVYYGSLNPSAEEENMYPGGLVWSKDGSVVVGITTRGRGLVYDYSNSEQTHDELRYSYIEHVDAAQYNRILTSHGGRGRSIDFSGWESYYKASRHAWPWEIWRFAKLQNPE